MMQHCAHLLLLLLSATSCTCPHHLFHLAHDKGLLLLLLLRLQYTADATGPASCCCWPHHLFHRAHDQGLHCYSCCCCYCCGCCIQLM
jgi:hypothetical protein